MAILEDVEVKVILNRTGQPLVEYANPDPEAIIEAREVEKYIEAEIGAEFSIQVTLKAGFNFHLANGVNVYINIDGGTFKRYAFQRKPRHLALMSGKLLHDLVITRSTSESQHGQVSYSASYAFGSAVVDENLNLDNTMLQKELALGSIFVKIERVRSHARKVPRQRSRRELLQSQKINKNIIAKSNSNTFQVIPRTKINGPGLSTTVETRLSGKYGNVGKYKFYYRSHTALQYLGYIPTTPRPTPISEKLPAQLTGVEKIAEIKRLRAEVIKLMDSADSQRAEIQQLMQANRIQAQKLQESANLNEKLDALRAAFRSVGNIIAPAATPIPASSSV
ncbi:hypothetical protein MMC32_007146 [Xylographa parallela]|nr:hypothetical protein [Xylographa parallela]